VIELGTVCAEHMAVHLRHDAGDFAVVRKKPCIGRQRQPDLAVRERVFVERVRQAAKSRAVVKDEQASQPRLPQILKAAIMAGFIELKLRQQRERRRASPCGLICAVIRNEPSISGRAIEQAEPAQHAAEFGTAERKPEEPRGLERLLSRRLGYRKREFFQIGQDGNQRAPDLFIAVVEEILGQAIGRAGLACNDLQLADADSRRWPISAEQEVVFEIELARRHL
jgi:hypothetical protein